MTDSSNSATISNIAPKEFEAFLEELRRQLESAYPGKFDCQPCCGSGLLSTITIALKSSNETAVIIYIRLMDKYIGIGMGKGLGAGLVEKVFEQDVPLSDTIAKGVVPDLAFWLVDFNQFVSVLSTRCKQVYPHLELRAKNHSLAGTKVDAKVFVCELNSIALSVQWKELEDGSRLVRVRSWEAFRNEAMQEDEEEGSWEDRRDPDAFDFESAMQEDEEEVGWENRPDPGTFNFGPDVPVSKIVDCESFWGAFALAIHEVENHSTFTKNRNCIFCA
jgi:hypothetical protein